MREYVKGDVSIDGRNIPIRLVTARDYFEAKEFSDEDVDRFVETGVFHMVNEIMGLKQACFLMRRVSHSCGSLGEDLYSLKGRLISYLKEKHDFDFDDTFVNEYGFTDKQLKEMGIRA